MLWVLDFPVWAPLMCLFGVDWERPLGYWGARAMGLFAPIPILLWFSWSVAAVLQWLDKVTASKAQRSPVESDRPPPHLENDDTLVTKVGDSTGVRRLVIRDLVQVS